MNDSTAADQKLASIIRGLEKYPLFLTVSDCHDVTGISRSQIIAQSQDPKDAMPEFLRAPGAATWRVPKEWFIDWLRTWSSAPGPAKFPPPPIYSGKVHQPAGEDDDDGFADI